METISVLLIERGWLMAWWMLVPAGAMAGIWVLAILGDRHPGGPARTRE